MHINEIAELYTNANTYKMKTMPTTFSRFEKYIRYSICSKIAGIYFIYLKDGTLAYIGETGNCIKARIARHKMSMNSPENIGERSGIKFTKHGLQDHCFVLKYISAEDLHINTKHDRLTAEALFVTHLKPIVYN